MTVQLYTMHAGRGGVIYRDTQSVMLFSVLFSPVLSKYLQNVLFVFFFQPHMHAHISMSELIEIAHACDERVARFIFL